MYPKGANLLHTIRQVINNDTLFRSIMRGLNKTFYHHTITSKQVEDYISKESGMDFKKVFDQYLRGTKIPVLHLQVKGNTLKYRWRMW
jgi:aminopeptidase N